MAYDPPPAQLIGGAEDVEAAPLDHALPILAQVWAVMLEEPLPEPVVHVVQVVVGGPIHLVGGKGVRIALDDHFAGPLVAVVVPHPQLHVEKRLALRAERGEITRADETPGEM